jgi:hypothetical protein
MARRFQEFLGFDDIPIRIIYRAKEQVRARAGTSKDEDVDVQEADVTEVEAHVYEGDDLDGEDFEVPAGRNLDTDD